MSVQRVWRAGLDSLTPGKMNTRSLPTITTTSDIGGLPGGLVYNGQIVFSLTDGLCYRYDSGSSGLVGFGAAGGGLVTTTADAGNKNHEARYYATSAQSIPNVTDTKIQFPNTLYASADVTPSGSGNTDFTLNRDGVWSITAGIRYVGVAGGLERHIFLQTGTSFNVANRIGFRTDGNVGSDPVSLVVSTQARVTSGVSVFAAAFQNSGGAVNTDPLAGSVTHGYVYISFAWLRPL